jgi:hypothetical protein
MDVSLKDVITTSMSVASLLLSGYALWLVQFNHGRLKMTQPTLLCMKRELPSMRPKIFFRTLLFTTGPKGRAIENMFLRVRQDYGTYTFDFWGHTENGKLTLGSGLFVGSTGIVSDHHFNPSGEAPSDFLFVNGNYVVEVFATVIGRQKSEKLIRLTFTLDSQQAAELVQIPTRDLYLLWNADTRSYGGQVDHDAHLPVLET